MGYNRELEASVLMRVYNLSKTQIVFLGSLMALAFVIALIAGLNGPQIVHQEIQNADYVSSFRRSVEVVFYTPKLSAMEQDLWINLKILVRDEQHSSLIFSKPIFFNLTLSSRNSNEVKFSNPHKFFKTSNVVCIEGDCQEVFLLHFSPLNNSIYRIETLINDLPNEVLKFNKIKIIFVRYSIGFAHFEIWSRVISLCFLIGFAIFYYQGIKNFHLNDWSIEQKWISVLLPLMILYDNPFYPISFISSSWIPRFMDSFFQITLIITLLLFWLCVFHGIRTDKRDFCSFYAPKIALVVPMWLLSVSFIGYKLRKEFSDPTFDIINQVSLITTVKFLSILFAIVYIIVLLTLFFRVVSYVRMLPFFNVRLYLFALLAIIVTLFCLTSLLIRFGFTRYINDPNYNDHNSSSGYRSSIEISLVYMALNSYMACLVIIYSPSPNAQVDSLYRDNPGISMLNDREETIIYEAGKEETSFKLE